MKVYKFGGVSVQNEKNVRAILKVLNQTGYKSTIIVVSAMGKTTNALEDVIQAYFQNNDTYKILIDRIEEEHLEIVKKLFSNYTEVYNDIKNIFKNLRSLLINNTSDNFNFLYDQTVSFGEIISSRILSSFLNYSGITNTWIDSKNYLKTDDNYREGTIDWERTQKQFENFDTSQTYVTQGFIASNSGNFTVTLGREGSDYSAAIIAYCLHAEGVTIWKDVPGIMTGDPDYYENAQLLKSLSYEEAMDMSFFGASILHPKTIFPLYKGEIPLNIRSFLELENHGTYITKGIKGDPSVSCFIQKLNVHLLTISSIYFTYNLEDTLCILFKQLTELNIKTNMIKVSACSVSLVIEDKFNSINILLNILANSFNVTLEENVRLFTITNSSQKIRNNFKKGKTVLLEQLVKQTYQAIVKE